MRGKLNGAAPMSVAALRGAGGAAENFVEGLRRLQEACGAGNFLGATGAAMVLSGLAWGCYRVMLACPYLLCILVGVLFMVVSLVMRPGGVLVLLPEFVQDLLLRKTVFDMLYDDTNVQNLTRKWGRMLMLCYGEWAAADIRVLTAGLDPAFVDTVIRRTFLQYLPAPLRTVLLPSPRPVPVPGALVAPGGWPRGSPEEAVQTAAATGVNSVGVPSDLGGPPLSAQKISKLLKEKAQDKDKRITEPGLDQAIYGLFGIWPTSLRMGETILGRAWGLLTVSTLIASLSAACLYLPWSRGMLLKGLARLPMKQAILGADGAGGGRLAEHSARGASVLGLMSAGGCLVVALASRRLAAMREAIPRSSSSAAASAAAAAQKEDEPTPREEELRTKVGELEERLRRQQMDHEVSKEATLAELRSRLARSEARNRECEERLAALGKAAPAEASASPSASSSAGATGAGATASPAPEAPELDAEGLRRRTEVSAGEKKGSD